MKYEHLWADMHSNIHHNQMQDLDRWYQHAKQVMDFWPIAYYPFAIRRTPTGGELEDLIPSEDCARDWAQNAPKPRAGPCSPAMNGRATAWTGTTMCFSPIPMGFLPNRVPTAN